MFDYRNAGISKSGGPMEVCSELELKGVIWGVM